MPRLGRVSDSVELVFIVADIRSTLGQLHAAYQAYQNAFRLLADLGNPVVMGLEDLHRGVSDLYREWNRLDQAEDHLLAAEELSDQLILMPDWRHRLSVSWARLKMTQGDLEAALGWLDHAEQHYMRTPLPVLRSFEAWRARVWMRQGALDAAQDWVARHGLTDAGEITYRREFDLITLARLWLARGIADPGEAAWSRLHALLARLLHAAQAGGRLGSAIEILVMRALAQVAEGDPPGALEPLRQALDLAEPSGYLRLFVDEGLPMQMLLGEAVKQGRATAYMRRLLAAFSAAPDQPGAPQPLSEPLTERELEVLRLLATDQSGPEIARHLIISLSTLRTHIRNIYGKLGVNSRRAAVRRTSELTLR
ncbi:MAG: hypothetical protein HC915_01325 [Anaerolineae bacterium]|nr:hypothetical protein [Anaerolineae bacterium]